MAKGKLILICQSDGKFVRNDDGSLSYTGGAAEAVDITRETMFDSLKFKLAEIWNLDYKSLSIKYFLPGNRRTLITLSNDKDLKRMYDFHGNSVTADVFVIAREGFDHEAFDRHSTRICGIKLAETVIATVAAQVAATVPVAVNAIAATTDTALEVPLVAHAPLTLPISVSTESLLAVVATSQSPTIVTTTSNPGTAQAITSAIGAASSSTAGLVTITADRSALADTVKKRRRTAFWENGQAGPRIVSLTDNAVGARKGTSQKKSVQQRTSTSVSEDVEQQIDINPRLDDATCASIVANSSSVPRQNLIALWKDGITGVGQDFKSVHEFRDTLQKYAIANRFMYRLRKNDTHRASGICVAEHCSWRIHASLVPSAGVFRIKKMNKLHTCGEKSWKAAHPTKNWLVNIIKERLHESPHQKPKDIANGILRDFGIALNYTQVWRGIEDARKQLQGSYEEAYSHLPWFCDKIVEANPGSFVKLVIGDDRKFQHLFVSFYGSMHGFQFGCRPLLFLDAISLKSKYHEALFTATALDGDDGIFPVAFAVVNIENDDSWRWFLEQLRSAVSTSRSITFVSDKEKGLMKSVLEVFKNAHHGYSIYYLMENFMKGLKGPFHGDGKASLPRSLLGAAHAVRLDGFRIFTEQINRVSLKAYDWIMQIEPQHWTNALFKGEHYSQITFNVAESYIKWIQEAWELPIIQKLEVLRCKMVELIDNRRNNSSGWSAKLAPSKEEKLQEESQRAFGLKVLLSSDTLFEVHDNCINVVDIAKGDCSCLNWKATGLPCRHAIAVFKCTGRSVYEYCSKYFTVDSFRLTYSESIHPVSSLFKPSGEEEAEHVIPPCISRPPKQEKKKQNKAKGSATRSVCCTRCKRTGHNKATCKETVQSKCSPICR